MTLRIFGRPIRDTELRIVLDGSICADPSLRNSMSERHLFFWLIGGQEGFFRRTPCVTVARHGGFWLFS